MAKNANERVATTLLPRFSRVRSTSFNVPISKRNVFAVVDESNADRTKGFGCTSAGKTVRSAHEFVNGKYRVPLEPSRLAYV